MIVTTEAEFKRLPVLPLRGLTAFPNMIIHFDVGRLMSIRALEASMKRMLSELPFRSLLRTRTQTGMPVPKNRFAGKPITASRTFNF